MIDSTSSSGKLALDARELNGLRQAAKQNSPDALKASAKQFEALFMNMMLKSMREATPQDGLFDSEQSKMYTSMLDQQLSQTLASRGLGLADVLVRQLSSVKGMPAPGEAAAGANAAGMPNGGLPEAPAGLSRKTSPAGGNPATSAAALPPTANDSRPAHIRAFHERLGAHAEEASRATGIPAKFMLGQAALESGWGKREIRGADGATSHNLFGIKATSAWKGKTVTAATTEYINGVPQTRMEKFRAYDSYADAFRDYANLLRNNPRYENVLANAQDASSFAQGLQKAGYATDPHYAAKLSRLIKTSFST